MALRLKPGGLFLATGFIDPYGIDPCFILRS
jgi:hypothetical protein